MSSITPRDSPAIQSAVMVFLRRRSLATVVLDVIMYLQPWKYSAGRWIQFQSYLLVESSAFHSRLVNDSCYQAGLPGDHIGHPA